MIVWFRRQPTNERWLSGILLRNSNVGADHNSRRRCGNKRRRLGPQHACITPRNYRPVGIKYGEMIRVALTDAAYDAIASTLPKGAARWPMQRDRGQCFSGRGGGDRPHEGHAQAWRELQRNHLAARRIKDKRRKCAVRIAGCAVLPARAGEQLSYLTRRCRARADRSEDAQLGCLIGRGLGAAHPNSLSSRPAWRGCRQAACKSLL